MGSAEGFIFVKVISVLFLVSLVFMVSGQGGQRGISTAMLTKRSVGLGGMPEIKNLLFTLTGLVGSKGCSASISCLTVSIIEV